MRGQPPDLTYTPNDYPYEVVKDPLSVGAPGSPIGATAATPDFY